MCLILPARLPQRSWPVHNKITLDNSDANLYFHFMADQEENKNQNEPSELQKLEEDLAACVKQKDEYLAGWQRAKADFINYKKDEAERFKNFAVLNMGVLFEELIGVLDSFDFGLAMVKSDAAAYKGMEMIKIKLEDVLKKFGCEKMDSVVGQPFNPEQHEVVGEIESADKAAGTIIEEIGKGYFFNQRVLRPAKVKIAKAGNLK